MKKLCSMILVVTFSLSMLLSLSACGNKSNTSEVTIWFGGSLLGLNEQEEPEETWIINELLKEYQTANNVSIKTTFFEDEEAMVQLIENNSLLGGEVPDIACLYSCEILRDMSDIIYPIKKYISEEEQEAIMYWETVTNNGLSFDDSQEVLGIPINGAEVTFMAYNKDIMKQIGINMPEETPQTPDQFYEFCEKIKAYGITPIVAGDNGWNQLYVQLFAKRWLQYSGDENIISVGKGQIKYSDDQNLIESLWLANDFYNRGFINTDYPTCENSDTLFVNGKGAMYVCSNLEISTFREIMGDSFGAFLIPDYTDGVVIPHITFGGSNQCLSTFKDSKHKEEAVKIIKWLSTKENNIRFVSKSGAFPNRNDISLEDYDKSPDEITEMAFSVRSYAHCTPDYLVPLNVYSDFSRYSLSVIIGELSIDDFTSKMESTTYN